ncbi:DUF4142 domain-containing protein [Rufibacter sp. LB8]|uniref:DUF4142 domain-containing protein n=1 Tax=Rufibacter sp. LB8 TaxID=2777781 RepID=UPI00178C51EC|nr:DUF4142 domain-containing protein [Rufibacter sp. LB8]
MKTYLTIFCVVALAWGMASCGDSSDSTSVDAAGKHNEKLLESTGKDEKAGWFVAEAASAGMLEAELGRLASSKAQDARVKQYGQLMLDHHTQGNKQLKQIADLKNLITPTSLGEDHQEIYNELMSQSGAAFDKAYMQSMVKSHKETIDRFEQMANEGTDLELKNFAAKTLPMLRAHLEQAEQIEDALEA